MKSFLLACLLLIFSSDAWGNETVKTWIREMRAEDRVQLERFLRSMVQTINGYVIFGDKPIGLFSYLNSTVCLPSEHKNAGVFTKGKELWLRLNISPYNKEYLFAIFNSYGYCNFIAINRKAFIKAVNENLSLFRYVLGPTLTAEGLLQELLDAKDDFYQVLKNDNVLLGILFGYGTQNALLVSRVETLSCDKVGDQQEEFPFLPYLMRIHGKGGPRNQVNSPSLGYQTVYEEIEELGKRFSPSHKNPPFRPYELPWFCCEKDTEETQRLLETYKRNQACLLKAVDEPDFLEITLTKFLTMTSGEIEIPPPVQSRDPIFDASKESVSENFAELLALHVHVVENRSQNLCLQSFMKGMEAEEANGSEPEKDGYDAVWRETIQLNEELIRAERLKQADDYFNRLRQSENLVCLIPNGIYYKILKKGKGETATSKIKKVSLHYSYKTQGSKKPCLIGTIQDENPESFISGMIHALIGMKRGEERWVAIHPRYGYGDDTFLLPNSTLIIKFQLLDFEEGDQEITIAPPHQLKIKNIQEMQTRFDSLKSKKYQENGREMWHAIKKSGDVIDLHIVKKAVQEILADQKNCPFQTMEEAHQYSIDLQEYLLSQKEKAAAPLLYTGAS